MCVHHRVYINTVQHAIGTVCLLTRVWKMQRIIDKLINTWILMI